MRQCGKSPATVFGRNNHAEEAILFEECPNFWRQIVQFMGNLPVVELPTQVFDFAIKKGLFRAGQLTDGKIV